MADRARPLLVLAIGGNAMQGGGEGSWAQEWFAGLERSLPEFPRRSMGRKVEAAIGFVEGGSGHAVITSLDQVAGALEGHAGTYIVRDP